MILHILVHIQGVELLCIKSGKEHTHHKQKINRLLVRFALLHSLIDIVVVVLEIVCCECCAEVTVIVIHDLLKFIRSHIVGLKALVHACLGIILT